jgi:agmatine/peptidylarginine deiminase
MGLSLAEIQRHRGELIERARGQRETVRTFLDSQRNTLWLADRGLAFAIVQPRRALRWAFNAWSLFRLIRKVSRAFA